MKEEREGRKREHGWQMKNRVRRDRLSAIEKKGEEEIAWMEGEEMGGKERA